MTYVWNYFWSYGFGYGLQLKAEVFLGPNIWLRPKVKIAPTVQHWFLEKDSIKRPVHTIFFSNSRSLEHPGLIIETLEYQSIPIWKKNLLHITNPPIFNSKVQKFKFYFVSSQWKSGSNDVVVLLVKLKFYHHQENTYVNIFNIQ